MDYDSDTVSKTPTFLYKSGLGYGLFTAMGQWLRARAIYRDGNEENKTPEKFEEAVRNHLTFLFAYRCTWYI